MNVGEKIIRYKEILGHKNFQDFGKAAGVSGNWLNDISKREKIQQVNDLDNLVKLSDYLGLTINQLVTNDEDIENNRETIDNIDLDDNDVEVIINKLISMTSKDGVKINGQLMNDKSREIFKDSLEVAIMLCKQHL